MLEGFLGASLALIESGCARRPVLKDPRRERLVHARCIAHEDMERFVGVTPPSSQALFLASHSRSGRCFLSG